MKMYGYEVKFWNDCTQDAETAKGITSGDSMADAFNNVVKSYCNENEENVLAIYIFPFGSDDCVGREDVEWFFNETSHVS